MVRRKAKKINGETNKPATRRGPKLAEGTIRTLDEMADVKVTGAFLIHLFGYSAIANLSRLSSIGVLPQSDGHGSYPLIETIKRYVLYMRQRPSARDVSAGDRNRHMSAKADIEELKAKVLSGELIPISEIGPVYERSFVMVKSRALSLPAKIAAKLGMCQNAVEAQELVRGEIEELLRDAEISPVDFKGRKAKLIGQGRPPKLRETEEADADDD
jgi:hypothetical protein